jgi:hypothetical protein
MKFEFLAAITINAIALLYVNRVNFTILQAFGRNPLPPS